MGRKLIATTLLNGVVYDIGTDEADIDGADTITAQVWDGEPDPDGDGDPEGYDSWNVAALKAEVKRRNDERDDDEVKVAEPGNKADLIAALAADDDA